MSDMNTLNGASVRDTNGRIGRVVSVTESHVNVAWMEKGVISENKGLERTSIPSDLQVLTLKEGWRPMMEVVGKKLSVLPAKAQELMKDLDSIVEAVAKKGKKAFGKKKHSPFKNFGDLGPGPDQSFTTREVSKKTRWDCTKTSPYRQKCVLLKKDAKGRLRKTSKVKNIRIKRGYKLSYNATYKPWRSKQGW